MESSVKAKKIALLFIIVLLFFILFLSVIFYRITAERKLPTLETTKIDTAIRGSIISRDGFTLAGSKKIYKAIVNTHNIDPNKKELFIKLFSIYSKLDPAAIKKALQAKGSVVLSYNIDSKTAKNLKELAITLNTLGVFVEYEDEETKKSFKYGLSIVESGEKREYYYSNAIEPIVGYIKKVDEDDLTKISGVKGMERYYNDYLDPKQNGFQRGQRDVGFNLILSKESEEIDRIDGYDLFLNIPLKIQKKIENIADASRKNTKAKEVVIGVMDSSNCDILALATSNRFNPNGIEKDDYKNLNPSFSEYPFEPGSVIKPIVFSLLLDKKLINPLSMISLYGGRYKLKDKIITDTHKEESLSLEDVIVFSSNIGMAQISQKLEALDFFKGMQDFGFSKPSGVDLGIDRAGVIPNVAQLKNEIYKATLSYGYGMEATFLHILKAYNAFNNSGMLCEPLIGGYIRDNNENYYSVRKFFKKEGTTKAISQQTADRMSKIMIKAVQKGTGTAADVPGLMIGGKTGTAHIAKGGTYVNQYNSSFFGFANDGKRRFTIGIVVFELDSADAYFASQTAAPAFKEVAELLVREKYLTPEINVPTIMSKQR